MAGITYCYVGGRIARTFLHLHNIYEHLLRASPSERRLETSLINFGAKEVEQCFLHVALRAKQHGCHNPACHSCSFRKENPICTIRMLDAHVIMVRPIGKPAKALEAGSTSLPDGP